jgi:hypothetical protein
VALVVGGVQTQAGALAMAAAFLGLTAWLSRHDLARRTVKQSGLPRFVAVGLLSGYAWLAIAGPLMPLAAGASAGVRYDAALHAALLGFVFAMIFGHAPIIFPAVLGVPVPFRPAFYVQLFVLHLSVAVRVGGDLTAARRAVPEAQTVTIDIVHEPPWHSEMMSAAAKRQLGWPE